MDDLTAGALLKLMMGRSLGIISKNLMNAHCIDCKKFNTDDCPFILNSKNEICYDFEKNRRTEILEKTFTLRWIMITSANAQKRRNKNDQI